MVLQLLQDNKTKTRRIPSPQNSTINGPTCPRGIWPELDLQRAWVDSGPSPTGNQGPYIKAYYPRTESLSDPSEGPCVYRVYSRVQPGDVIWVKETWAPCQVNGVDGYVAYKADKPEKDFYPLYVRGETSIHRAARICRVRRWKSPIHMPRWASRISLEVTAVRAERLQDVSERDAKAEGVKRSHWYCPTSDEDTHVNLGALRQPHLDTCNHLNGLANLWASLHGEQSWDQNPLVWVYEFRRISK